MGLFWATLSAMIISPPKTPLPSNPPSYVSDETGQPFIVATRNVHFSARPPQGLRRTDTEIRMAEREALVLGAMGKVADGTKHLVRRAWRTVVRLVRSI